jgi:hypothetical protein
MALAVLVFCALLQLHPLLADGPIPHRSIRQPQSHPRDDRDWPRYTRRKSQLGWEYYSRHFVVTSTSGPDQAERGADSFGSPTSGPTRTISRRSASRLSA